MRTSILLFALLLLASLVWAQGAARLGNGNTGQRQADKAQDQFEKTAPLPLTNRGRQCGEGHAPEGSDR